MLGCFVGLGVGVRHEQDVQNLVDQIVGRYGRIDVEVNNAATEGTPGRGKYT